MVNNNNNNINLVIKKISKIYDNLTDIKNILVEDYTNLYSIDTINQLLSEIYDLIIFIYKDIFLLNTSKSLIDYLQNIRINVNKINYIIRYILIYQYQRQATQTEDINYNIFDEQFLLSKEFYNYVSNDSSELQDLKKKLMNYYIMNNKFVLVYTTFDCELINDNFDIYCGIKYGLQIFINNEVIISKFVTKLKSVKKNSTNMVFDSYLTKKMKIFSTEQSSSTSSNSSKSKISSSLKLSNFLSKTHSCKIKKKPKKKKNFFYKKLINLKKKLINLISKIDIAQIIILILLFSLSIIKKNSTNYEKNNENLFL